MWILGVSGRGIMTKVVSGNFGGGPPNRIKELRERLGLDQKDFAAKVGTSPATICRLENGEIRLDVGSGSWAEKLSKALGVEQSKLIVQDSAKPLVDQLRKRGRDQDEEIAYLKEQIKNLWAIIDGLRKQNGDI